MIDRERPTFFEAWFLKVENNMDGYATPSIASEFYIDCYALLTIHHTHMHLILSCTHSKNFAVLSYCNYGIRILHFIGMALY